MPIHKELYGTTDDGQEVHSYTLTNGNNYEVRAISYGGIITHILAPDKHGQQTDIVLGFDSFTGYKKRHPYFGALIGRYGNRIADATFTLDGVTYQLAKNFKDKHNLHGGVQGFDKRVWETSVDRDRLVFQYVSPAGEEGFPGTLTTVVTYQLTPDNKLIINYTAETDAPTIVNLTNHSYFNLAGHAAGSLDGHVIQIHAPHYLPTDEYTLPLGNLEPVASTALDLTSDTPLAARLKEVPGGYGFDHNFCLGNPGTMKLAAKVSHPNSGRYMNVHTTEPGLQLYTGCNMPDDVVGKGDVTYQKFASFCLEAQHYPNSVNQESFPSTVLRPGEFYMQTTVYEFGVQK